jgi:hypothetical protein
MRQRICLNERDNFGPVAVTASRFEMEQIAGRMGVPMVGSTVLKYKTLASELYERSLSARVFEITH